MRTCVTLPVFWPIESEGTILLTKQVDHLGWRVLHGYPETYGGVRYCC